MRIALIINAASGSLGNGFDTARCVSPSNHDPGKLLANHLLEHKKRHFERGYDRRRVTTPIRAFQMILQ